MSSSLNHAIPLAPTHGYPQHTTTQSEVREEFVMDSITPKLEQLNEGNHPYHQVYHDNHQYHQATNSYLNNFQISSNISPTSPSFPQGYPTPTRGQSYCSYPQNQNQSQNQTHQNQILSPLRSSADVPPSTYAQFYSTSQPTGMASLMNNRSIPTSLNLSTVGLRTDTMNVNNQSNHYPSNYTPYPYNLQPDLRRNIDHSFLPSPGLRTPGYQRSNGFVSLPLVNNHLSNGMNTPTSLMPPMNTPMSGNDQIAFLSQNPQYLSGLAGQALGSSGKISRAIAAQLFARDEHTDRFPCTLCGQSFKRINGLKRHLMMHLHIKPYKCEMCGRGFCRIDVYKRHVNRAKCNKESTNPINSKFGLIS